MPRHRTIVIGRPRPRTSDKLERHQQFVAAIPSIGVIDLKDRAIF